MPKKEIDCKNILRLHEFHKSQNAIATTLHVSKGSVNSVLNAVRTAGITWEQVQNMDNSNLYQLLFPQKRMAEKLFCKPFYDWIYKDLLDPKATLRSCWAAYKDQCGQSGRTWISYSGFCAGYADYIEENALLNRAVYKMGHVFAGMWVEDAFPYKIDRKTDQKAFLYIGLLPVSGLVFLELTKSCTEDDFIRCTGHALESIGGVPDVLEIPFSRKPHSRKGTGSTVTVTDAVLDMQRYYHMRINTEMRKDSARFYASFIREIADEIRRCRTSQTFDSLQKAVSKTAQKHAGITAAAEKEAMMPVPDKIYDVITEVPQSVVVQQNSHVKYQGNYYSAPYAYRGQEVKIRYTDAKLVLVSGETAIAEHPRFQCFVQHQYATRAEDMPPAGKRPRMDRMRYQQWAANIGPCTAEVIRKIFERVQYEEQAYNTANSLLQLSKTAGNNFLENACQAALITSPAPGYRMVVERLQR